MLSEQIHRAIGPGRNRFQICQLTAKGVKAMHRPGSRFEETISLALGSLASERRVARKDLPVEDAVAEVQI